MNDLTTLARFMEAENESLRLDLAEAHDQRRKAQGENLMLRDKLTRLANDFEARSLTYDGAGPTENRDRINTAAHIREILQDNQPDMPDDDGAWRDGHSELAVDDEGCLLMHIDPRPTHPGRARRIALKILAAARYAEKEGD